MTTPNAPNASDDADEIIPLFKIEMKSTVPDYMGKYGWSVIGGPYEKLDAVNRTLWLEENHDHREYRMVKVNDV